MPEPAASENEWDLPDGQIGREGAFKAEKPALTHLLPLSFTRATREASGVPFLRQDEA